MSEVYKVENCEITIKNIQHTQNLSVLAENKAAWFWYGWIILNWKKPQIDLNKYMTESKRDELKCMQLYQILTSCSKLN